MGSKLWLDWWVLWPACSTFISVWQYVKLSMQLYPCDTLCWAIKQPRNQHSLKHDTPCSSPDPSACHHCCCWHQRQLWWYHRMHQPELHFPSFPASPHCGSNLSKPQEGLPAAAVTVAPLPKPCTGVRTAGMGNPQDGRVVGNGGDGGGGRRSLRGAYVVLALQASSQQFRCFQTHHHSRLLESL